MEAKRAACLSEDRGSCVFLDEVSSVKYARLAKDKRPMYLEKQLFNSGVVVIQERRM